MKDYEYQLEDYEFKDENGNIYISTPEYNPVPGMVYLLAFACCMFTACPFILAAMC